VRAKLPAAAARTLVGSMLASILPATGILQNPERPDPAYTGTPSLKILFDSLMILYPELDIIYYLWYYIFHEFRKPSFYRP
jgi:hypothetical protein